MSCVLLRLLLCPPAKTVSCYIEYDEFLAEALWYEDVAMLQAGKHKAEAESSMPDQDEEPTPEETDEFIQMQVLLPKEMKTLPASNHQALEARRGW